MLPEPRGPAGVALIFLVGCAVIAATTLDVHRNMVNNARPVAKEDLEELVEYKRQLDSWQAAKQSRGRAHRRAEPDVKS